MMLFSTGLLAKASISAPDSSTATAATARRKPSMRHR
jgi:hypothetical protein